MSQTKSWAGDANNYLHTHTFGFCGSVMYPTAIDSFNFAQGCLVAGAHGFGATTITGNITGIPAFGVSATFEASDAHNPAELGGPFITHADSFGIATASTSRGRGPCGRQITTVDAGLAISTLTVGEGMTNTDDHGWQGSPT